MAAKQIIQKHYQRILASWPVDRLRPDAAFTKVVQQRVDKYLGPSHIGTEKNIAANEAHVTVPTPKPFDEKAELKQVNALYSLLENRYLKRFPVSDKMMKPESDPQHYEKLLREIEEAPTRSWLQAKLNSWKGWLRWR